MPPLPPLKRLKVDHGNGIAAGTQPNEAPPPPPPPSSSSSSTPTVEVSNLKLYRIAFDIPSNIANQFSPPLPVLTDPTVTYHPLFESKKIHPQQPSLFLSGMGYTRPGTSFIDYDRIISSMKFVSNVKVTHGTPQSQPIRLYYPLPTPILKLPANSEGKEINKDGKGSINVAVVNQQYAVKAVWTGDSNKSPTNKAHPALPGWLLYLNEFRAYQSLSHLNGSIAKMVIDACYADTDGRAYLVTEYMNPSEYIRLVDLLHWDIQGAHLSLEFCKRVAESLTSVLRTLHNSGWCHNDLHDKNVMVHLPTGSVCLYDFGLAMTFETERRMFEQRHVGPNEQLIIGHIKHNGKLYDEFLISYSLWCFTNRSTAAQSICNLLPFYDRYAHLMHQKVDSTVQKSRLDLLSAYGYWLLQCERPSIAVYVPPGQLNDNNKANGYRVLCGTGGYDGGRAMFTAAAKCYTPANSKMVQWITPRASSSSTPTIPAGTPRALFKAFTQDDKSPHPSQRTFTFGLVKPVPSSPRDISQWKLDPNAKPIAGSFWSLYPNPPDEEPPYGQFVSELRFLDAVRGIPGFPQVIDVNVNSKCTEGVIKYAPLHPEYQIVRHHKQKDSWTTPFAHMMAWRMCDLLAVLHSVGIIHGRSSFDNFLIRPSTGECMLVNGYRSRLRYTEQRCFESSTSSSSSKYKKTRYTGEVYDYFLLADEFKGAGFKDAAMHVLSAIPQKLESPRDLELTLSSKAWSECKGFVGQQMYAEQQYATKKLESVLKGDQPPPSTPPPPPSPSPSPSHHHHHSNGHGHGHSSGSQRRYSSRKRRR